MVPTSEAVLQIRIRDKESDAFLTGGSGMESQDLGSGLIDQE